MLLPLTPLAMLCELLACGRYSNEQVVIRLELGAPHCGNAMGFAVVQKAAR